MNKKVHIAQVYSQRQDLPSGGSTRWGWFPFLQELSSLTDTWGWGWDELRGGGVSGPLDEL